MQDFAAQQLSKQQMNEAIMHAAAKSGLNNINKNFRCCVRRTPIPKRR